MSTQPRVGIPAAAARREVPLQGDYLEAYQPRLFAARQRFIAALDAPGATGPVLKEILRLRNAGITDCEY